MSTNSAAISRPQTTATPLQRGMVITLGTILVLGLLLFHLRNNFVPGRPTAEGMDVVQAARHVANGNGLQTGILRPLVMRYVRPNSDGSLPDTAHSPLHSVLLGVAMRVMGDNGPGGGDRTAARLSLLFFVTSLGACYLLARRLFGTGGALLACVLYALAANAVPLAIDPRPLMLATTLFTLLLLALLGLDVAGTPQRAGIGRAAWAGFLFGCLFLTLYSSLLLLVPILVYIWSVSKRDPRAVGVFMAAALLNPFTLMFLIRNTVVAGNPFFHARLLELVMHTETYPSFTLYRTLGMAQSVPEYLAGGGIAEILRKLGRNLLGYYSNATYHFGILLLPLFLVASLTRFTSPQVNRVRFLVYVLLGLYILGVSLFLPYQDSMAALIIFLPFAAAIATTFFLNFIRARNLPPFYARVAVTAWIVIACVPGVVQLFGGAAAQAATFHEIFNHLNGPVSPVVQNVRESSDKVIMSEVPWEVAYRVGAPCLWLPNDSNEFRLAETRANRSVALIVLTPTLLTGYGNDPEAAPWVATYAGISSVFGMAYRLPEADQQEFLSKVPFQYPPEIQEVMAGFTPTRPFLESGGRQFSLLFVNKQMDFKTAAQ